jgi:crossover junction endodeoxyribonuclease RuvC
MKKESSHRILGIDPGFGRTGFAILDRQPGERPHLIDCGIISTLAGLAFSERLVHIANDLDEIIARHSPTAACVEHIYFAKNAKTAMQVAHARGVVLERISRHGLALAELTPMQVKMAITGFGRADKQQVENMVISILGIDRVPQPDDAVDAIACALSFPLEHQLLLSTSLSSSS